MPQPHDPAGPGFHTPSNSSSPETGPGFHCPTLEELAAWFERREPHSMPALAEHAQKCPRCSHLLALAESAQGRSGIDDGLADHDLLEVQPGLRKPMPPVVKKQRFSKAKVKFSARTWELLTGQSAPRRKP